MFDLIFDSLASLLSFFYELVPNYALAIALLTVAVMFLLFPLTAKGARSMMKMSKLQPELKRLQQTHKNDRAKLNEETMALFKEHKVSPIGGCLPLLAQGPVLFIMYQVLIGLTRRGDDRTFDPKYISHDSALYQALDGAREMVSFGVDLAQTASDAARESFLTAIPYFTLIALTVFTGYYQQRQMTRRNPQQPNPDNPMAESMQRMTKLMPLMYLVFGFTLPAGILVYFVVSSIFRIGQQAFIYRHDESLQVGEGKPVIEGRASEKPRTTPPRPSTTTRAVTDGRASGNGRPQSGRVGGGGGSSSAKKKRKKR
jgi:YidC/Oxa1 family membrane protein insertase